MPSSNYRPTVADVGAILRTRTKTATGDELGTFTADTRPTAVQVGLLIDQALGDVAIEVGEDIPEALWPAAKRVVALGAAVQVELTFFPEQIQPGRSPYPQLLALYEGSAGRPGALARLVAALGELGPDGAGDVGPSQDNAPAFSFPPDFGGLVGWGTRW